MALLKQQNDLLGDAALALSLLTRLPIKIDDAGYARSAQAAWAYPLVGVVSGIFSCIAVWGAVTLGLPLWCAAIGAIAAGVIVTGAMHEDGLADCSDGFWGGWDRAMRLLIMKDSQIGTYGVLALFITQGLRFGAIWEILHHENWALTLIAVHIASRAVMPAVMSALPHARESGLSQTVGHVPRAAAVKAAAIGGATLLLGFGLSGIALCIVAALAAFGVASLARAKIGGQTGDVCGASQQVTEIALLLAILAGE